MGRDSVKTYLALATGVSSLTRDRALGLARSVVTQGESTAGQVQALAEELVSSSRSNREALIGLIRYEVDRALGRLGLASADEVAALRARVRTLEANLRAVEAALGKPRTAAPTNKAAASGTTGAP